MEINRHLTAAGFVLSGKLSGMGIDLQNLVNPPHPENLFINPVDNPSALVTFAHALCQGFQVPQDMLEPMIDQALAMELEIDGPLVNYVGFLNGRPVATSSLYLESGVAGIYNVSTLPTVRRQGFGTAITMAPLLEAKNRGYRYAVLHASAVARAMYERIGFRTYCHFHQYIWPARDRN